MAEVDTSSYPKPPALPVQKSLLDNVGQFQQLESNKLGIDQKKLELADKGLQYMTRALTSLGPNASEQQYLKVGEDAVKLGLAPPNTLNIYVDKLNSYKKPNGQFDSQGFFNEAVTSAASHQQTIDYHLGRPGIIDTGNATQPIITSPKPGFGVRSTGLPIATQPGPGQIEYGTDNQPRFRGVKPAEAAPGMVTAPPPINTNVLPVRPIGGATAPTPNQIVQNRSTGEPVGAASGPTPLFEEGKKLYIADQENAAQKMIGIQPVIQALDLMKTPGFNSGPGTKAFTAAMATAKTWGLIDSAGENDPTAAYQQIAKKLADYVSRSPVANRSDAALTLKEAASPNPGVQTLTALKKLSEDAVALDRMEAARPGAFRKEIKDAKGNVIKVPDRNMENYADHRSLFPQSMDYRAFKLDQMGDKGPELVTKMDEKLKKNPKDKEALKFFKSLEIAQKYYQ